MKIIYSKYAGSNGLHVEATSTSALKSKMSIRFIEIILVIGALFSTATLFAQSSVKITVPEADMSSFKAMEVTPGAGSVIVMWTITNENKSVVYVIERSTDSFNFTPIGKVTGTPMAESKSYTYTDPKPLAGSSFYRIIKVDHDGTYNYTGIYSVNEGAPEMAISLPKPSTTGTQTIPTNQ